MAIIYSGKKFRHNCQLYILCSLLLFINMICSAQQTIYIDTIKYSCATNFNISVRTKNLQNTVALQGTISWDTSIIKYNGLSAGSSTITMDETNMNLSDTAKGRFTFLWYDNDLTGKNSIDDSSLFGIHFIRNGTGKGKAIISFISNPTQLEVDTISTDGIPFKNDNAVFVNGYIGTPFNYVFTGSGDWDNAANWVQHLIPPAVLPECSQIVIDPEITGQCVLKGPQTISSGASITVVAGKKFIIPENLIIQ